MAILIAAMLPLLWTTSASAAPTLGVEVAADPAIAKRGDEGVKFVVTARNTNAPGGDPTSGEYSVSLDLPAGLTVHNAQGGGYACDYVSWVCTRSNVIAAGGAAQAVTFFAEVSMDAPDQLTVTATVSGGGALSPASDDVAIEVEDRLPFGLSSFTTKLADADGNDYPQAGGHGFSGNTTFAFNTYLSGTAQHLPVEHVRRIETHLPRGFVANPLATKTVCTMRLAAKQSCPDSSLVGYATFKIKSTPSAPGWATPALVFNIKPNKGAPAALTFSVVGTPILIEAELRSDSDYGVNAVVANNPTNPAVTDFTMTLCGREIQYTGFQFAPQNVRCESGEVDGPRTFGKPFLTNPASLCPDENPVTKMLISSWEHPSVLKEFSADSPKITGCELLTFEPTATIVPTVTEADAPTGLNVDLDFPTEDNDAGLAPPALKKAVVTLPEGMAINPSAADGLGACSDDQLKLRSKEPVACPESSKIGTVAAKTPLLAETVSGGVFIRSQNSNDPESGEMYRLALVLENEERGISVRLPGSVRADKQTGRLVTTFDNNPELPVSEIDLQLKDGPRAALSTPATCGEKAIDIELSSWGGQTVTTQSTFTVDCAPGLGSFAPGFAAGTAGSKAGSSSPFSLAIVRKGTDQELKAIRSIALPEGLLGDVSSVPLCSEDAAKVGVCGEDSRIGHVQVAAGAGTQPLWVPQAGKTPTGVYLTGPYNGAPYGLSVKVPAQAGPFNLGTVVVRSALHVDERTAAITTGVDESILVDPNGPVTQVLPGDLPRILKGVLLNQREIRVIVDRDGFMLNPTDCSEQQITAELHGYGGGSANVGNRFQATDCADLGFAPKFRARILDKGRRSTVRSWHPRTRFTVVPRKGDANIGGARVALPSSTILDQSNIGTTCTRAQMAEEACPAKSVVGYAKAWSPLLRKAVEGPVYLAANGGARPLPDLAAVLDGEIRVVLQGEISTLRTGGKARLQNTFRVVPDAPVSRFVLTMRGGKNRGLLVNSTDLCRTNERGVAVFNGQNGLRERLGLRLATRFKGCVKVRRQATRRKAARQKMARRSVSTNLTRLLDSGRQ